VTLDLLLLIPELLIYRYIFWCNFW